MARSEIYIQRDVVINFPHHHDAICIEVNDSGEDDMAEDRVSPSGTKDPSYIDAIVPLITLPF
jgi:hypothetical protein